MAIPSEHVEERPPTPPQHPTYGVRLSDDEIKAIIFGALQEDVDTIEQLPSGKSFNNRIYFITLPVRTASDEDLAGNNVVVKTPGWNFGADKIQNEVISLLLLEKHCPQIPVPRVLAWCEGGEVIQRTLRLAHSVPSQRDRRDDEVQILSHRAINPSQIADSRSWILMTHLPGQTLQPSQIGPEQMDGIMEQLAGYMSQWRGIPAPTQQIGNLRFIDPGSWNLTSGKTTMLFGRKIAVQGLLIGSAPSEIRSSQDYYITKLRGELAILQENENYARNRAIIIPLIEELLRDILPHTALFHRNKGSDTTSIFTHYDLSPRNILICPDASGRLHISGVVDFEFSGFFPAEEEFTNTCVAGKGDWPSQAWFVFIEHLEACGVDVPRGELWQQACAVVGIVDHIAPWRLRGGGVEGGALQGALREARLGIEEEVRLLKGG